MFLHADSEDSDQTADVQADLSLCLAQMSFCLIERPLIYTLRKKKRAV